jgi:carbamate kinase
MSNTEKKEDICPFAECGAMSQGYIGYHLQQAMETEFEKRRMRKRIVTIISQVEVAKNDMAFNNPTKPIGTFYTKKEAIPLARAGLGTYKEDAGRGYRRVVPSPKPIKICELATIKKIVEEKDIVITCGGGGIPVVKEKFGYKGVDAVIDKDRTSALLACELNADILLILTTVEKVSINFNKPNEIKLGNLSLSQAKEYIEAKEFAEGSMLPKIEACMYFVEHSKGKKAIITSLAKARLAIEGKTGTAIEGGK